jgi:hypothetical protein
MAFWNHPAIPNFNNYRNTEMKMDQAQALDGLVFPSGAVHLACRMTRT